MGAGILIVYATVEGQSAKVAEFLAEHAREAGFTTEVAAADEPNAALDARRYRAVIVGGSVHEGHHSPALVRFMSRQRQTLAELPSAVFSVSLAVAGADEQDRREAERYCEELLEATGWEPQQHWLVAGALRYTQYSWLKRSLMKRIAAGAGYPTDTDQDVEFTDWEQLRAQLDDFLKAIPQPESSDAAADDAQAAEGYRVLCAMDFSPCAMEALAVATYMAKLKGGRLRVVHVFNTPIYLEWTGGTGMAPDHVTYVDEMRERLSKELGALCEQISEVVAEPVLIDGQPLQALVDLSAGADLLVMGTHGRQGVARALLGSVAERVVRSAHCPVLTVPVRES